MTVVLDIVHCINLVINLAITVLASTSMRKYRQIAPALQRSLSLQWYLWCGNRDPLFCFGGNKINFQWFQESGMLRYLTMAVLGKQHATDRFFRLFFKYFELRSMLCSWYVTGANLFWGINR